MNAGGDLHDSWGHIRPGLSRAVMAYLSLSLELLTASFHSEKCPGLDENNTVTLVIVSSSSGCK